MHSDTAFKNNNNQAFIDVRFDCQFIMSVIPEEKRCFIS